MNFFELTYSTQKYYGRRDVINKGFFLNVFMDNIGKKCYVSKKILSTPHVYMDFSLLLLLFDIMPFVKKQRPTDTYLTLEIVLSRKNFLNFFFTANLFRSLTFKDLTSQQQLNFLKFKISNDIFLDLLPLSDKYSNLGNITFFLPLKNCQLIDKKNFYVSSIINYLC